MALKNFIDFFLFNDYVTEDYCVISLSISNCQKEEFLLIDEEYKLIMKKKVNTKNNCYLPGKQFGESLNEIQRKEKYKLYVDNCIYMIKKRTKRMLKLI